VITLNQANILYRRRQDTRRHTKVRTRILVPCKHGGLDKLVCEIRGLLCQGQHTIGMVLVKVLSDISRCRRVII
jgi:hypothetical protein